MYPVYRVRRKNREGGVDGSNFPLIEKWYSVWTGTSSESLTLCIRDSLYPSSSGKEILGKGKGESHPKMKGKDTPPLQGILC